MAHQYNSDLSHMSPSEIEAFYISYLTEKATDLVKIYNLSPKLSSRLHSLFPEELAHKQCEYCSGDLYAPRLRKSEIENNQLFRIGKCEECGHKHSLTSDLEDFSDSEFNCNCPTCKENRKIIAKIERDNAAAKEKEEREKNSKRLWDAFDADVAYRYLPFTENSESYHLADIAMLMALLFSRWTNKEGGNSNDYISSIESASTFVYACDSDITNHPLSTCIKKHLIRFDLSRCYFDYFKLSDNNPITYYPFKIPFQTNFINEDGETLTNKQVYEWLSRKFSDGYLYSDWKDQLLDVWISLGVAECIEYAKSKAEEYNFRFEYESKVSEIIRDLLHHHSVSECFYFISTAYWNAAAFVQSNKATCRKHAENTVPGKIISLANSGKTKYWDRPQSLPRSAFSLMLFDVILNAKNDAGFYLCPEENYQDLLNNCKVEWPEPCDEPVSINITGEGGVYDFFGCLPDATFEESNDSVGQQLANLAWIARVLGLQKAAEAINEQLLADAEGCAAEDGPA